MEIPVIQIGNSKGIRLSKTLLERYGIKGKVELILEEDCIMLKPKHEPRKGWEEAFRQMHKNQDDTPLIDDVFEDESMEEW